MSDPNAPNPSGGIAGSGAPAPAPVPSTGTTGTTTAPAPAPAPPTATPVAAGTRAQRAARRAAQLRLLKIILDEIIDVDQDDSPLAKALAEAGVQSLEELVNLREDDIANLAYTDSTTSNPIPVLPAIKNRVRLFALWHRTLCEDGTVTDGSEYEHKPALTREAFGRFRISAPIMDSPVTPSAPSPRARLSSVGLGTPGAHPRTPASGTSSVKSVSSYSLADSFKKGIKKSIDDYEVLKENFEDYDEWLRSTISTADMQNCGPVLDPSFVPRNPDEQELFVEQNKFMYRVFQKILASNSIASMFLRKHFQSGNAQAVWSELIRYRMDSVATDDRSNTLLREMSNQKLGPSYHGSSTQFITSFEKKMNEYNDLQSASNRIPPDHQKRMLKSALEQVKTFDEVDNYERMQIAMGHPPLSYAKYLQSALHHASKHDKRVALLARARARGRAVHHTEYDARYDVNNMTIDEIQEYLAAVHAIPAQDESQSERDWIGHAARRYHLNAARNSEEPPEDTVDALAMANDIFGNHRPEAYAASQRPKRAPNPQTRLPPDAFAKLSRSDQRLWAQMSEPSRRVLLEQLGSMGNKSSGGGSRSVQFADEQPLADEHPDDLLDSSEVPGPPDYLARASSTASSRSNQSNASTPGDIRRLLSRSQAGGSSPSRSSNFTSWVVNAQLITGPDHLSLVDRGANGGIAGGNTRVLYYTDKKVTINAVGNHRIPDLPIVTAGGVATDEDGNDILLVMHQFAYLDHGSTILSALQLESFGTIVDDGSKKLRPDSNQALITIDGFIFPLAFKNGLPYLSIRPYTDQELEDLPQITITSDVDWDPSIFDDIQPHPSSTVQHQEWELISEARLATTDSGAISTPVSLPSLREIDATTLSPSIKDMKALREFFLWAPPQVIKRTFEATTQYARTGWITGGIYDTHKAPFPALNVRRRNEPVATDTVFSNTPAIDSGARSAQFFVGCNTFFCDIIPLRSDDDFVGTLQEVIRKRGAMDLLISDRAKAEVSKTVQDLLRHLCIRDWQSEPHHQNQNPAERRYQNVKRNTNLVLNATGAPPSYWLLCMEYTCFVMNRMAMFSLRWRTPYEALQGSTPDISMIYRFRFYDRIYFKRVDSSGQTPFPGTSDEVAGYFAGFAESVGHQMTYKIVSEETNRIMFRSRIRLASERPNLRLDSVVPPIPPEEYDTTDLLPIPADDDYEHVVQSKSESTGAPMAVFDPDNLIGRSFVTDADPS